MRARVVIGSNFGDEGKGLITDYLCAQGAGVVVRFNGGAQAGHTVVSPDGVRHVFHHFGSGSFHGVPTFLSQFFVCNPILFFSELNDLIKLGLEPKVYAHPDCLVTTFADMMINQAIENKRSTKRHGSCGIGFHETMNRSQLKHLKITMADLWNDSARLESQIEEIATKYAKFRCEEIFDDPKYLEAFVKGCREFAQLVEPAGIGQCDDPVFEGAQGLLLDQNNKKFFPHVTHSNTGMKNVRVLMQQAGIDEAEIYYVSRSYLTRHGAGDLPGENPAMAFEDNTNKPNPFQGTLRFAALDVDDWQERCALDAGNDRYKTVITHCDQVAPPYEADLYSSGPTRANVSESVPA